MAYRPFTIRSMTEVVIRPFQAGDEAAFRALNEEWIVRYFGMESKDEQIFSDPHASVLKKGGMILFATIAGKCVGCCALLRIGEAEFEVAKMAVAPECRGAGVGRQLLQAVIEEGKSAGAKRLYLETNHVLEPAIHLYESLGFRHVPAERITPSPYARSDVQMEMNL